MKYCRVIILFRNGFRNTIYSYRFGYLTKWIHIIVFPTRQKKKKKMRQQHLL